MQRLAPFLMLLWPAMAFASPVTIYTQFANPPSALSIEHMKAELDTIMAPLGFDFDWRSLEEADGHQVTVELVVVSFKGECRTDCLRRPGPRTGPLGWTHVANGEILPFADVDCDRIRELMTLPLAQAVPPERARLLGRAMARVLAHELYHFLMNTPRHSSTGIAKSAYTAAELASEHLRFDDAELLVAREERLHPLRARQ